jgi:hypothetical protein
MKNYLTIETKEYWEIPGYTKRFFEFYLPLGVSEARFHDRCDDDEDIVVYSVNGKIVGYYQPSLNYAIFLDVYDRFQYCMNGGHISEPLPINLRNLPNGVQWTEVWEDGKEEEIFIQLV